MDKYEVEKNMGAAKEAISKVFKDDKIDKTMRSKMSAFGAMVLMSGVTPAIAYYSENQPKVVELLAEMYLGNCQDDKKEQVKKEQVKKEEFFKKIIEKMKVNEKQDDKKKQEVTEQIINYSISLKLAFNLFELT